MSFLSRYDSNTIALFIRLGAIAIAGIGFLLFLYLRPMVISGFAEPLKISAEPVLIELPDVNRSTKRSFDDATCDKMTDMVEIDRQLLSYDKHNLRTYPGYKGDDGLLHFKERSNVVALDMDKSLFSSKRKIDLANVNGQHCADLVFSELKSFIFEDSVRFSVALNKGDGSFEMQEHKTSNSRELFSERMVREILEIVSRRDITAKKASSKVHMDWGDFDGNQTGDFAILTENYFDLNVDILYTELDPQGGMKFKGKKSFTIDWFMFARDAIDLDIEDYNADGKADILVRHRFRFARDISVSFAINNGNGFTAHKDSIVTLPEDFDLVNVYASEKDDSLDINFDGAADVVNIGEVNNKPYLVGFIVNPQ